MEKIYLFQNHPNQTNLVVFYYINYDDEEDERKE